MTQPSQTCLILAGGLGTRLRSVVKDRPKCLAPVGNRSFLDIQIARFAEAGITDIVLALGYGADLVLDQIGSDTPRLPVRHVIEKELLGTGGAIVHAMDALALDEILVANGDTYLEGDLSQLLQPLDRTSGELFRMAIVAVADRFRFGGVLTNSEGRVLGFVEKGQSGGGLINAGLYRLCRAALPSHHLGPLSLETEVLPFLAKQNYLRAAQIDGSFIDIGVPADYQRFCQMYAA